MMQENPSLSKKTLLLENKVAAKKKKKHEHEK
jgi:hypothetical protein